MSSYQGHRPYARWLTTLLTLTALLASCGSSAQTAPVATIAAAPLPADWQRIALQQIALALPATWVTATPEDQDLGQAATDMATQNPALKTALDQGRVALASGQVQLIAYDFDPDRAAEVSFPANVRIGRQTLPEPPDPAKVAEVNEQDLRKTAGFSDVQRATVSVGPTPATRLTSKLQINDATGQPIKLALEQYVLVQGNDVYAVTFTSDQKQQGQYRNMFDQILGTLRFSGTAGG